MSAPRFFVEGMTLADGEQAELPEAAAHHAARVLRLAAGDAITLFDGSGGEHTATIVRIDKRCVHVEIGRFAAIEREANAAVTLVMSVIATDTMDIAVRRAVELGVARIEPVLAARSQASARGERAARRVAHWRQIVQAACEQCGRNRVPAVAEIVPIAERIAAAGAQDVMLVPGARVALARRVNDSAPDALIVGPEGGFTDAELSLAERQHVSQAHLGPRMLRAETAAIAALAIVTALAG